MKTWLYLTVSMVGLVCPGPLGAASQDLLAQKRAETTEEEVWLDDAHAEVSQTLRQASAWMDSFFDDNRSVEEENRTRARLKLGLRYSEAEAFELEPRINLRLHLPQLSKKASMILFAADDDKPEIGASRTDPGFFGKDERKAGAALQYFLNEGEKYNISFTGGGATGYLYGGLRYRHTKEFADWQTRFRTQLRYYTDDGLVNLNSLDCDRELSKIWFFRTTTQLEWLEEDSELPLTLAFRLYQVLDEDRVLSYEWENRMEEIDQGEISEVMLLFRYRQRFLREWLFWEVSPRVTFDDDQDWDSEYAVLVKVDITFGYPAH